MDLGGLGSRACPCLEPQLMPYPPAPMQVDLLVSEPMGTLLVNERMLETYLYARDHFLKPGGKMYPVSAACHACFVLVWCGVGSRESSGC